ncbi:MAG: DUF1559 domain-containing protein [Planctomycetia bacterium]|nr:DUF1559 domain-containing protein [Planctomycetia bacterium]
MKIQFSKGFTLVELLVVMVIITILVAILLPAVQQAREAARRSVCENNQRQLAIACINHENHIGSFPSGGWGPSYVGDPDMAGGASQPGSWLFSILPFIEQNDIYMLAADGNKSSLTNKQKAGALETLQARIPTFLCPSRRSTSDNLPLFSDKTFINSDDVPSPYAVCKSDYAGNSGSNLGTSSYTSGQYYFNPDPRALADIYGTQSSSWSSTWDTSNNDARDKSDGIMHRRTSVTIEDITDGTSKTYMLGEKYVCPNFYLRTNATFTAVGDSSSATYAVIGDGRSAYAGCCSDNQRSAGPNPMQDTVNLRLSGTISMVKRTRSTGMQITVSEVDYTGTYSPFGSAHSGSFGMAFCDGSVHRISYGIDPAVHSSMGTRNGSEAVDLSAAFKR